MTLGGLVYLVYTRPYATRSQNRLELFNEIFVLFCLFLAMLMYLSIQTIKDNKAGLAMYEDTGLFFAGCLVICLVLNIGRIFCNVMA